MVLLAEKRRLLWASSGPMPENALLAVNGDWEIIPCPSPQAAAGQLRQADLALISLSEADALNPRAVSQLLDAIDRSGAVAIVLLPGHLAEHDHLAQRRGQFILVDADAPPADLTARIEAAAALQPAIKRLRAEVASARSLGATIPQGIQQLDEEMRLAARIQQDFLPRSLPAVGPVRFAALFRPAGWVSGDLYDVLRLDETHVAFYVADVVGHGLPAALLTMFIKKALQTKRIEEHTYQIVPPQDVLGQLNADICQQNFTSCQFCTAFYGIVDAESLLLQYARGGHPAPLLVEPGGAIRQVESEGPLLGVFPGEAFPGRQVQLSPGDRLVVFTDGVEEVFALATGSPGSEALKAEIRRLAHLPPEEMVLQLARRIDDCSPAMRKDDITLLAMQVNQ